MEGIQNFLEFVIEHWTSVVVIACIIFLIVTRIKAFFSHSKEERIEIAKEQIRQAILKWVADAEVDYAEWQKSGAIKRSQVIQKIYTEFPVISKVVDQDSLVKFIDDAIDEALKTVREVVDNNPEAIKTSE